MVSYFTRAVLTLILRKLPEYISQSINRRRQKSDDRLEQLLPRRPKLLAHTGRDGLLKLRQLVDLFLLELFGQLAHQRLDVGDEAHVWGLEVRGHFELFDGLRSGLRLSPLPDFRIWREREFAA